MSRMLLAALLTFACVACGGTTPVGDVGDPDTNDPGSNEEPQVPTSDPVHDTIAYATADGDAIRLVAPDGSDDRLLWEHGQADTEGTYAVWSMSWRPDARELAFVSTHESFCSIYASDVFVVAADGSHDRRVTQPPGCDELSEYPQGTVNVPVRNTGFASFDGFLYFQGAPSAQQVSLPAGGTGTAVFENVADFGDGDAGIQAGAIVHGGSRAIVASTAVDVIAGGSVTTGAVDVYAPAAGWEVRDPTWSRDGSRLGYVLNFASLWSSDPFPSELAFGSAILASEPSMPNFAHHVAWGPTDATADQLLYAGTESFDSVAIYRVSESAADAGDEIVSFPSTESIEGLAWLPDGSGFVFSVTEGEYFGEDRSSNLFVHDFASGATTRVTDFVGEFAGRVSVAPDGERFAFERAPAVDDLGALQDPDVWIVDRDGGGAALLAEDAYAPAWSP